MGVLGGSGGGLVMNLVNLDDAKGASIHHHPIYLASKKIVVPLSLDYFLGGSPFLEGLKSWWLWSRVERPRGGLEKPHGSSQGGTRSAPPRLFGIKKTAGSFSLRQTMPAREFSRVLETWG